MNAYSPVENSQRIEQGMLALIAGHAIEFTKKNNDLIVVFDSPFDRFSAGRILLFQQFFLDCTGIIPEIVRQVPACVKVFFSLGELEMDLKQRISLILKSGEAERLYEALRISQVQYRSEMIRRPAEGRLNANDLG